MHIIEDSKSHTHTYMVGRNKFINSVTQTRLVFRQYNKAQPVTIFVYMDRPGTCIILDKKYNIANNSCHFGS